jgi:hypothetical protein
MAEKVQKCGSKTIRYPADCSYSCVCPAGNSPCTWTVKCGGTTHTGTGLIANGHRPPKRPHVTLDGTIADIAELLQVAWQRRVIVPPSLRRRKIQKRTFKGTPEQIAASLGLELGPKTRKKTRYPKGDFVWIDR